MRVRPLRLVRECKLAELIPLPSADAVLEASGVVARGRDCFVIFDNIRRVARIDQDLVPGSRRHAWMGRARASEGYEDIAYSPHTKRFYLLVEAEKHPDGTYKAVIEEFDDQFVHRRRGWVDFPFERRNRGFEGLSALRWRGRDYLLALCEGNRCRAGRKGRKPGGGRIQVLQKKGAGWQPIAQIKLPRRVMFEDYSALAVRGDRIAVVSQTTSQLWLGTLRPSDWTVAGRGRLYEFPRGKTKKAKKGKKRRLRYCTVEGVSWLSANMLVTVSDLSKRGYAPRCGRKDQSIHLFRLP